jgi:hypothetical protein
LEDKLIAQQEADRAEDEDDDAYPYEEDIGGLEQALDVETRL